MKNLFLNRELSLIAKEKGFNEPCFAHYREEKKWKLIPNSELIREMDAIMFPDDGENGCRIDAFRLLENHNQNKYINWAAAPLYDQIISWFEKKHIFIYDYLNISDGTFKYYGRINTIVDYELKHQYSSRAKSDKYQALTKAIEEALKLI